MGGQDIQILTSALQNANDIYGSAQGRLAGMKPGDEGYGDARKQYEEAAKDVAMYAAELQKAELAQNQLASSLMQFGNAAQTTLENGLGKTLTDIETKTGKVRDAISSMARSLLGEFNDRMFQGLFNQVFGPPDGKPGIGHGIGGGSVGILTSILGLFGLHGPAPSPSTGGSDFNIPDVGSGSDFAPQVDFGAADGGVFPGGLRFLASGGIVKGGRGQMAIIGEGGIGADEAVVPLRNGFVPIGQDSGGYHAILPGSGRTIPAAMFADGGITGGGVATRGIFGSSMMSPGNGAGDGVGDIHVTHQTILDGKTIAEQVHTITKEQRKAEMVRMLGPNGQGRRVLSKK